MYNGKHNSNTINHLQQAQPVQNEWECSTRLSIDCCQSPSTLLAFSQSLLFKDKIKRGKVMCETLQQQSNTNTCTFQVFQELVQPEGSCNRRQGSHQYKHKIISIQITCTFQVFQEVWFSLKVAAIKDKGHINTSTK